MTYHYHHKTKNSNLFFHSVSVSLKRNFFEESHLAILTIAWNNGDEKEITIDGVKHIMPKDSILPLMANQTFEIKDSTDVIAWQFNKDFYCIVDHDNEVGCAGFLFYNPMWPMFIVVDSTNQARLSALAEVFKDEFQNKDSIQGEMLLMLLKRLIIMVTRLGKQQYVLESTTNTELDLLREFNLLVELHFARKHQVQDYADLLSKSPKTLSNAFKKAGELSPVQIIHLRIIQEAKRLLLYSDKSIKEIGFDLGFDEAATFSRFFKKNLTITPGEYKESIQNYD